MSVTDWTSLVLVKICGIELDEWSGVNRLPADEGGEVQMTACRETCCAHQTDHLPGLHLIPDMHHADAGIRHVVVGTHRSSIGLVAVIYLHAVAETRHHGGIAHRAGPGSAHGCSARGADVQAVMDLAGAGHRIGPGAEG